MGNFHNDDLCRVAGDQGIIQNTLTLQGNAQSNNTISGVWTVGGVGGAGIHNVLAEDQTQV